MDGRTVTEDDAAVEAAKVAAVRYIVFAKRAAMIL